MKKGLLLTVAMILAVVLSVSAPVLAASERPAIISNGNVSLSSAYLVEGNVYSVNGNVAYGTGAASACIHDGSSVVTSEHNVTFFNQWNMPDFRGDIIKDDSLSFPYEPVAAPAAPSGLPSVSICPNNITESFSTSTLRLGGNYIIDTSASDIFIVADTLNFVWGSITVTGDNNAYIFVDEKVVINGGTEINSTGNLSFVIENASFMNASVSYANIYITGPNLDANGGGTLYGNVFVTNSSCLISGNHSIYGTVYAPVTDVSMSGAATVYGTVIAKSFTNPGNCTIIYDPYYYNIPAASVQSGEPEENEAEINTTPANVSASNPIALSNDYAYILGKDDRTMGADMPMLRGEASSVLYRLLKQNDELRGFTFSASSEPVFSDIAGRWDRSAIEFTTYLGVYDASAEKIYVDSPIARGEAFKLFAIALGMTDETALSYDDYANMLIEKGYVQGDENGNININNNITRAEYCKIYNLIIGRDEMDLVDEEGNEITPATYGFTDFDESKWYYEIMLKATSAYTNGKVDLSKRAIRNIIDDYVG